MIVNFNKNHIDEKLIKMVKQIFDYAIDYLKVPCKELEVNIAVVGRLKIKQLNKKFRAVNKVTDVLSFPYLLKPNETGMHLIYDHLTKENFPYSVDPETGNILIGDLYVCFGKMKKQAKEYGTGIEREFTYLSLHGLLHLLGFDHLVEKDKKVMRETEENILKILQK